MLALPLETLESPWDNWKIKPSHPKGNIPWILTGCWSSNTLANWCKKLTRWKRPWFWERLKAGGEGDSRGGDGWILSLTQWTWVWANSWRWWRTGKPDVLQCMGVTKNLRNLATEQQQSFLNWINSVLEGGLGERHEISTISIGSAIPVEHKNHK